MIRSFARAGVCAASILAAGAATAGGRPDYENRSWFGHLDLGWVEPQSHTSDILDGDWTLTGGALFWPSDWPVGLAIDLGYNDLDLTAAAIAALNDAVSQDPNTTGSITSLSTKQE